MTSILLWCVISKISKQGTLAPLLGVGACVSVQFGAFESAKRVFIGLNRRSGNPIPEELSNAQVFASGSVCGLASSFVACPVEHVRTRLQIQTESKAAIASSETGLYKGPTDFVARTTKSHGIAGIFKGQGVTALREIIGLGIYFLVYERLIKETMTRSNLKSRTQVEPWKQGVYGALAGQAYWVIMYPIVSAPHVTSVISWLIPTSKCRTFSSQGSKPIALMHTRECIVPYSIALRSLLRRRECHHYTKVSTGLACPYRAILSAIVIC